MDTKVKITNADVTDDLVKFYRGHTVSFENVTVPIDFHVDIDNQCYAFATPGTPDVEYNWDKFSCDILVLTGGDDVFGAFEGFLVQQVYGGAGDDHIGESFYNSGMYMDGGDGNDVLTGTSGGRETLVGGNGNDTLEIVGPDKATGGAGADTFVMAGQFGDFWSGSGSAFICDLQTEGPDHDTIQLGGDPFEGHDYADFSAAAADGTVALRYAGGYTYLDLDTNKDHLPDTQIAHIKGVIAPDLVNSIILMPHTSALFGVAGA
jgi:Ca2+-binding RTX toxin-like protein